MELTRRNDLEEEVWLCLNLFWTCDELVADLVRHIESVEDQLLEVELDVKVEGVNDQASQLLNVTIEGIDFPTAGCLISLALSLFWLCLYSSLLCLSRLEFVRDQVAGVEANTELIIRSTFATRSHRLHDALMTLSAIIANYWSSCSWSCLHQNLPW